MAGTGSTLSPTDCFGGSSNLARTGSTIFSKRFSDRLFWRQLKFGRNWLHIIFQHIVLEEAHSYCFFTIIFWCIVLEAAQIWMELAPYYFLADCFGGNSAFAGTGFTLFSDRLFWRKLKFDGNWLHIIFQQIVLETAQIWQELAPHYFLTDCF